MSDTEFNSNMKTIEGGGGAVYGGNNSGDFITALETNEPIKDEKNTPTLVDNIVFNNAKITFGVTGRILTIESSIDWATLLNGIFLSAELTNEASGGSKYTFTLKQDNEIVKKLIADPKASTNLNSTIYKIGRKNELTLAMQKILNHVGNKNKDDAEKALRAATPAAVPSGGSTYFHHEYFEMSLNTFGSLALYNKMKIDDSEKKITQIDRSAGYAIDTKPLLQITSKENVESNHDITEEMKTLFRDFLTFFNFVIVLLTNNKLFINKQPKDDTLYNFFLKLEKETAKSIGSAGKVFNKEMNYAPGRMMGVQGTINIVKWQKTGMKKKKDVNDWKYVNGLEEDATKPDSGYAELESGFTLIMDMLKGVEAMNTNTNTNTMKVEIDLKEVCNLLAIVTQDFAVEGVKAKLVAALLAVQGDATANAEKYKEFLNGTYSGVLDTLIENVKDEEVTEADELKKVVVDLNNVSVELDNVAEALNAAKKPVAAGTAATAASTATTAAEEAAEKATATEKTELTDALQTAKGALNTAKGALEKANKALETAKAIQISGGQKSKTLKRKQQQKNKSRRRFAYGGRKAYDQRKKQRQQQN